MDAPTVASENKFKLKNKDSSLTLYLSNESNSLVITIIEDDSVPLRTFAQKFTLEDTIANAKFTSDNKNIFISDQTKSITKFKLKENITEEQNDKSSINIKNLKTWKFVIDSGRGIMATGGYNIFLYDYVNNKILKEIENKSKFVYSFCFLSNNKLATGNSNGSIYIYNTENYNKENKIEEHCLLVRNLAFNNNKNILYSASDDLHINQIDMNTLKLFSPMVGHKEPISDMIYNEKKGILVTSSFDGTIKIWDVKGNNNCIDTLEQSNKNPIWDITLSLEGDFIAYTANEGIGAFVLK